MAKYTTEELYDQAMKMYADDNTDTYIEFQFLDKGIEKDTIKEVINRIKKERKLERRSKGYKLMIGGIATIFVGVIFTIISYNSKSPIGYVLYGLIIAGFMSFVKGLMDIF